MPGCAWLVFSKTGLFSAQDCTLAFVKHIYEFVIDAEATARQGQADISRNLGPTFSGALYSLNNTAL